jgi:transcriptional regulator with XRE-family HTH domain
MTGAELRAARKAAKISQADLAKRVGVSRDTVQYWEAKHQIGRFSVGERMVLALGLQINLPPNARTGGWSLSWREQADAQFEVLFLAYLARNKKRQAQRLARLRVICGAKTRKGGTCCNKSEPGKQRCKFHGGKSTGPKTPEGRARIAKAQIQRWAKVKASGENILPDSMAISAKAMRQIYCSQ